MLHQKKPNLGKCLQLGLAEKVQSVCFALKECADGAAASVDRRRRATAHRHSVANASTEVPVPARMPSGSRSGCRLLCLRAGLRSKMSCGKVAAPNAWPRQCRRSECVVACVQVLPCWEEQCVRSRAWRGAQTHTRGGATPARARVLTRSSSPNINPAVPKQHLPPVSGRHARVKHACVCNIR